MKMIFKNTPERKRSVGKIPPPPKKIWLHDVENGLRKMDLRG
jgi:hypothetical protein